MSLLHQALDRWAERQPEALFALEVGRRMSYAEAASSTRRIAAGLVKAGLLPRARIAILARNRIEVVLVYYAASRAGVTVVPLNTRLAADELAYILADAEPLVVFVDEPFVDLVDRLRAAAAGERSAVCRARSGRRAPLGLGVIRDVARTRSRTGGGATARSRCRHLPAVHERHHWPTQGRRAHPARRVRQHRPDS